MQSTLLRAQIDVQASHSQYRAAALNVQSAAGVLQDADRVLEGMRLSYRKGASSLLELLNAQLRADDVYLGYLQAVPDLAIATSKLQLGAGARPTLR